VTLDLPVPPVQQLRLGVLGDLGDTHVPTPPPRPHLDDARGARVSCPLRVTARRHDVVAAVNGEHVDHDSPALAGLAAADPQGTSSGRKEFEFGGDDTAVAKCFLLWAGLVGAISLEVFGQYGADTLTEPGAVFDTRLRLLIDMLSG
jgi:hypothetical protein